MLQSLMGKYNNSKICCLEIRQHEGNFNIDLTRLSQMNTWSLWLEMSIMERKEEKVKFFQTKRGNEQDIVVRSEEIILAERNNSH